MAYRARAFATNLAGRFEIRLAYRKGNKILAVSKFLVFLIKLRPDVSYVFDMSYSGVLGAWLYRLVFRNKLLIETGDVIHELMKSTGNRSRFGLWLTRRLEGFSVTHADRIVVRGHDHQKYLKERGVASAVIQDGVDTREFKPIDASKLREQLGLSDVLTIGLVGSSVWSEKLQMCYGWELVETIRLLSNSRVRGIMIGSGSGIAHLKASCRQYNIEDRIIFLDHIPHEKLPEYLNLIDVCLSTQTNDLVGKVRTTGKLPLYLATGRYVLASDVGEASRVLPPEMLVAYRDVKDLEYPNKLADRIQQLIAEPKRLSRGANNTVVAKARFEYSLLAGMVANIITDVAPVQRTE